MARLFRDNRATTRLAFERVITLSLLALFCAALLLSVVNDAYAFFKPQGAVILTVSEPCTLFDFASLLEANGIVLNPHVFALYVRWMERAPMIEAFCGTLTLDRSMSYRQILQSVSAAS